MLTWTLNFSSFGKSMSGSTSFFSATTIFETGSCSIDLLLHSSDTKASSEALSENNLVKFFGKAPISFLGELISTEELTVYLCISVGCYTRLNSCYVIVIGSYVIVIGNYVTHALEYVGFAHASYGACTLCLSVMTCTLL